MRRRMKKARIGADLSKQCLFVWTLSRSIHPYENPEVLSFRVEDGSLPYMKWMDEAIRDK